MISKLDRSTLLESLVKTYLPTLLEHNQVAFYPKVKRRENKMLQHLEGGSRFIFKLKSQIIRNRFLYNCHLFTQDEPIEHLIIGYGKKQGPTTRVEKIQHIIGEQNQVSIPEVVSKNLQLWQATGVKNEVVVFHNHPEDWLGSLTGRLPLASETDRDTMIAYKLKPLYLLQTYFGGGGILFYVGEKGKVREIRIPTLNKISEILQLLNQQRKPNSRNY